MVTYWRLQTKDNFKLSALKVTLVPQKRWSLTRGFKYGDLTWKLLVFWETQSNTAFLFQAGGSQNQVLPPLDGMDVWNTISHGEPSPRKEILLNIDLSTAKSDYLSIPTFDGIARRTSKSGVLSIPHCQGIALRMGDMKLLMSVPNDTWYKPPELGGKSGKEQGILQEEHGQLNWLGTATEV